MSQPRRHCSDRAATAAERKRAERARKRDAASVTSTVTDAASVTVIELIPAEREWLVRNGLFPLTPEKDAANGLRSALDSAILTRRGLEIYTDHIANSRLVKRVPLLINNEMNERNYHIVSSILDKLKPVTEPFAARLTRDATATSEWHQRDYFGTNLTYCGVDPERVLIVPDDQLMLTDCVTCEACLEAIAEEEEE